MTSLPLTPIWLGSLQLRGLRPTRQWAGALPESWTMNCPTRRVIAEQKQRIDGLLAERSKLTAELRILTGVLEARNAELGTLRQASKATAG
jgi:hypothetical protein